MDYAFYIGGFKHGQLEAVHAPLFGLSAITFPVTNFTPVVHGVFDVWIKTDYIQYNLKGVYYLYHDRVFIYAEQESEITGKVTLEFIDQIMKEYYAPAIEKQLILPNWFFDANKVYIDGNRDWLNAGLRDAKRECLCYWCAEEIIGPGFGRVNDLLVPKGAGKRVRKLVCGNCGRGKFNRRGERIGDWPKENK